MNDQVLMGMTNRATKVYKQPEAVIQGEFVGLSPFSNRLAIDILHDNVRRTVIHLSAIKQIRDVRMIQRSQYLSFTLKSLGQSVRKHTGANDLDGDTVFKIVRDTSALIYRSHTALPDQALYLVSPNAFGRRRNCTLLTGAARSHNGSMLTVRCKQ